MTKKIVKLIAVFIVVFFGGAILLLSTRIGGIRAFIVQSASMEPAITTGSLVITQKVFPDSLVVRDIITFIRPDKQPREFVTHRIEKISDNKGTIVLETKGDNNSSGDAWQVAGGGVVGKVIFALPYLGYVLSLARTKVGITLLILVPAALIIMDEIRKITRLIKTTQKEKVEKNTTKLAIIIFIMLGISNTYSTNALMSYSVNMPSNHFTVLISPTPSPSPSTKCNDPINIVISGNGSSSNSSVKIDTTCSNSENQSNNITTGTKTETSSSTGNNNSSENSDGDIEIVTDNTKSVTTVTNSLETNQ